ncbi:MULTISPECIES: DUF2848 family protein [Arthrobacter]|uniref:DUF2848 family protein n=2 Tax=Arthrobacter TaxID=1663 RepID=A0ABU9KHL9_9MICC|nr:DUF2848 family protein [Arthrobacter sp. YJM1]MDP5225692.1 DUF2848 family protein [Arthrobacter sp. YJM1]
MPHALSFAVSGTGERIELTEFTAVVAGYTGRDAAAVQHHIDELAAIGVAPPPEVPMFYPVAPESVSTSAAFHVTGAETSGEIEPLYIRHAGRYYLGIASDHTDRRLETVDIGDSKKACPKPVAGTVIPVDDLAALSLDECTARSWVDGELYQEGTLSNLRTPADVVGLFLQRRQPGDGDFVCLGGTLPLLGGTFVYGTEWTLELSLPDGSSISHQYTTSPSTTSEGA